jgi:hypothetical protein
MFIFYQISIKLTMSDRPEYMMWVTNNAHTFVKGQNNLVACVFCVEIYETDVFEECHKCLVCEKCGVDALTVVKHCPLLRMSDEARTEKLIEWHKQGFSVLGRFGDDDEEQSAE